MVYSLMGVGWMCRAGRGGVVILDSRGYWGFWVGGEGGKWVYMDVGSGRSLGCGGESGGIGASVEMKLARGSGKGWG